MDELARLLGHVDLFDGLDPSTLEALADQLEVEYVSAGSTIVEEGEAGDCLYIVDSGRLRVSKMVDGSEIVLRELSRADVVGEMALLDDRPRSATVRAVRDSRIYRLGASSFADLVTQRPSVLSQVARLLITRLTSVHTPPLGSGAPRTVAMCPAGPDGSRVGRTAHLLAAELELTGRVCHVDTDMVNDALGRGAAERTPEGPGWGDLVNWFHAIERSHDHVIYETEVDLTPWSWTCLRQADLVLVVGAADGDPSLGAVEAATDTLTGSARRELVLVHPPFQPRPRGTARWLDRRAVDGHHHLRDGSAADVARLARLVRGEAYGLVLGGGGPRGLAHLGVIRALEETGIPIDFVGGTSIGAMMGAAVAAGLSDAERLQRIVEPIASRGRLLDVTLPILSLASATKISRMLSSQAGFGSLQIEDLPRPFFCVSADLSSADEVVHETGDLWRAIRASLSIPGVFPPVYERGRLLVDGAVLNNLPVDLMRERVGSGTVIAVDLLPEMDKLESSPFEPELSGWRALGRRLRPSIGSSSVPTILDVMSRSNALAGVRAQRDVLATTRVDLYLRPPMFPLGSFDFKAALPLVDLAYHDTMSVLETHDWGRRAAETPSER